MRHELMDRATGPTRAAACGRGGGPLAIAALVLVLASCGTRLSDPEAVAQPVSSTTAPTEPSTVLPSSTAEPPASLVGPPAPVEAGLPEIDTSGESVTRLLPVIEHIIPHDPTAYTQGLLIEGGRMFESTGQTGQSSLREVDPTTGEVIRQIDNDESVFAEGLEMVGDRLIQLTWQAGTAYVWNADDFALLDTYSYEGEGWGLCLDGERLVMSDGSATLSFRDPTTFEPVGRVEVTINGEPIERLNELECVAGYVLANVWQATQIMIIEPTSGRVVGQVDALELKQAADAQYEGSEVLNGIAYDEVSDRFYLTGKNWPLTFVVRFEPVP